MRSYLQLTRPDPNFVLPTHKAVAPPGSLPFPIRAPFGFERPGGTDEILFTPAGAARAPSEGVRPSGAAVVPTTDTALALGWLERLRVLTGAEAMTAAMASADRWGGLKTLARSQFTALGSVYRSMKRSPWADPEFRAAWRDYMGPLVNPYDLRGDLNENAPQNIPPSASTNGAPRTAWLRYNGQWADQFSSEPSFAALDFAKRIFDQDAGSRLQFDREGAILRPAIMLDAFGYEVDWLDSIAARAVRYTSAGVWQVSSTMDLGVGLRGWVNYVGLLVSDSYRSTYAPPRNLDFAIEVMPPLQQALDFIARMLASLTTRGLPAVAQQIADDVDRRAGSGVPDGTSIGNAGAAYWRYGGVLDDNRVPGEPPGFDRARWTTAGGGGPVVSQMASFVVPAVDGMPSGAGFTVFIDGTPRGTFVPGTPRSFSLGAGSHSWWVLDAANGWGGSGDFTLPSSAPVSLPVTRLGAPEGKGGPPQPEKGKGGGGEDKGPPPPPAPPPPPPAASYKVFFPATGEQRDAAGLAGVQTLVDGNVAVAPTLRYWTAGMPDWQLVSTLAGIRMPPATSTPPSLPRTATEILDQAEQARQGAVSWVKVGVTGALTGFGALLVKELWDYYKGTEE